MNKTFTLLAGLTAAILVWGTLAAEEAVSASPKTASEAPPATAVEGSAAEPDAAAARSRAEEPEQPPMRYGTPDAAVMALIEAAAAQGPGRPL
jgi:hypothetical protein